MQPLMRSNAIKEISSPNLWSSSNPLNLPLTEDLAKNRVLSEVANGSLVLERSPQSAEGVAQLQIYLNAVGYPIGNLTNNSLGIFGPGTEAAVTKFQHDHQLPVTGKLDQATLLEINNSFQKQYPGMRFINTQPGGIHGPHINFKSPLVNLPVTETTAKMLEQAVLDSGVQSIEISETTIRHSGIHSSTSNHLKGRAVDISKINGIPVLELSKQLNEPDNPVMALQEALDHNSNIRENFGPARQEKLHGYFPSEKIHRQHQHHIHFSSNT